MHNLPPTSLRCCFPSLGLRARLLVFTIAVSNVCISATASGEPAVFRTDVFVGGQDGYKSYRIPALVVTKGGTVLAFCEGRKNNARDYGDIDLLVKRSTDDGETWSDQMIVHEEGGDAEITIGNPCPIVDERGTVHLLFTRDNKRLFYTASKDDGRTWAEPIEHTEILKAFDYPMVRVATGPVHGIQLKSGRLVVPVWLCDRERKDANENSNNTRYRAGIIYSDDGGRTWMTGGLVAPDVSRLNECAVLERKDGSLYLNMRAYQAGFRGVAESFDGGLTWSRPALDKTLECPTCQAGVLGLPGSEALFANPASSTRTNLTVRLSRNEGRTWAHSRVLNPGPSGYCDLALTRNGRILCLYECGDKVYNEKISLARFDRKWILEGPSRPAVDE